MRRKINAARWAAGRQAHRRARRERAFGSVHLPSAFLTRPRFFNAWSAKDTARLLMSRPVALTCSAISATERAPCWPRTSAIAEPMVGRASARSFAAWVRFDVDPAAALVFRAE